MKKQLFNLLGFLLLCTGIKAQVANYTLSKSVGTYANLASPLAIVTATGAGASTSTDDANYNVALPFNFVFNGATITSGTNINVNTNGWLNFGTPIAADTYSAISTTTAGATGVVAAYSKDLNAYFGFTGSPVAANGSIGYEIQGIAPNRVLVIEWKNFRPYSFSTSTFNGLLNFQIQLFETTNEIAVVYGNTTLTGAASVGQVGIRGAATTYSNSVNNLMIDNIPTGTSCDWSNAVTGNNNNSSMYFNATNTLVAIPSGLTYKWAPPVNAALMPVRTFTAVTGISTTSATISWTAPSGATQYNIQYRVPGTCAWTNFSGNPVASNTTALTALTPSTVYQIRVQSSDGTNNAIWSHIPNAAGGGNGYTATGTFSTLATCPAITGLNTSTITGSTANFTWTPGGTETAWDVYYGTSPLAAPSASTVPTATTSASSYSATGLYSGTQYTVYVRANCGGGDISAWSPAKAFSTVTTCSVPTTFSVSAITHTSATFSWTSAASAFDVYYGPSPLAAPNATTVPTLTTSVNSYTATGLTPSTGYAVYVRAQCGGGDQSLWTSVRSFTTLCNPLNIPYTQDFESVTTPAIPTCNTVQNVGSGNIWTTSSPAGVSGFNSKTLTYAYSSSAAANTWYYTQGLNLTAGQSYRLTYNYANRGTTYTENLKVSYGSLPVNTAMTTTLTNHPGIITGTITPATVDFIPATTGVYYIGFNAYSTANQFNLYVDDIHVDITPTCFPPTALTTTNTTTTNTDLSFTAPVAGTPANYVYEVRTSGAVGSGTTGLAVTGTITAPSTSVTVTGLTSLTSYTVYVRSDCGAGDLSVWSAAKTFTTLANCPVPTALNTSTVMATSATFTWVAGGSETAWDVYYGTQPLTAPTASTAATATTSVASYMASALTQTTSYSVYVRANCGSGNTSIWTAVTNFTTPASCPATSTIAISALTATSAVATWTAGGVETSWFVKYSAPTMTAIAGPTPSYTMSGLTPSTNYSVQVKGICGAADSSLWTVVKTFMTPCLPPNVINPLGGTRCGTGTVTLSATADMGGTVEWFTSSTGGAAVATGTTYTTPSISSSTTYYVGASGGGTTESAGRPSTSATSGYLDTNTGLVFTATSNFVIQSAVVYPVGTGSITVALQNSAGTEITSTSAIAVTGNGSTPVTIPINLNVTPGTGYRLVTKAYTGITDLVRESGIGGYPYTSPSGAMSITNGYFLGTSSSYYYFYNIQISSACTSTRTAVTATVTTAPALTFNAPAAVCGGSGIATLSVTSTVSDYDSYTWSPATGLYTDAAATVSYTAGTNASIVYVNATAPGVLNYNVTANNSVSGCATAASASVSILDAPTSITVAATPTAICAGSTVSLSASANTVGGALLTEGFNGATNSWTTINNSTGGTPANASWSLTPSGYVLPGSTFTGTLVSNDNTQLYLTNSDQQGNGSKTRTILQSPAINTTNMTTLNLSFYHFYKYWATGDSAIMVQVSTNGTSWTTIKDYKTAAVTVGAPGALAAENLSLNTFTNNPTVYIRFSYNSTWGYGWAIDNVKVTGTSTNAYSYGWTSAPAGFTSAAATATDMPMASTVYSVVITNTNTSCSNSGSVSVAVNAIPTVTAGASSASVCAGSSATLTAGGATNYTWTAGGNASTQTVTPGALSVYTVTGETSGCSNTATVSVDVNQNPIVTAAASQTLLCDDGSTGSSILTASSTASSYLWSDGAMTMTTSVTPTTTTVYTVTATEMGCSTDAFVTVTVSNCTGVKEANSGNGISVYPNPTNGIVNISISSELSGTTSVEIYDAIGKLVITEKLTKDVSTINTSKLEDGIYMFKIINNNKAIKVGRMIKQ